MSAYYEQPLRKLLGSLSQTIGWLSEKGTIEVNAVPTEHLEAVKQLERIGIVHKRNNKIYELQKVRLKKLMDNMGMDSLPPPPVSPVQAMPAQPVITGVTTEVSIAPIAVPAQPAVTVTTQETSSVLTAQPVVATATASVEKAPVVTATVVAVEPGGIS